MPATRNGVYHALSESPWRHREGDVVFYFATRGHWEAFSSKLIPAQAKLSAEMTRRCGVEVDMSLAAAFKLYRSVETYGFYVTVGDIAATDPLAVAVGGSSADLT